MGILNTILGKEKAPGNEKKSIWIPLESQEDLNEAITFSETVPVAIFKHSTRCGISRMVLKQFENNVSEEILEDFKLYYLDLLNHRSLSNEIAAKFDVQHQSPQLLIIRNGIAIANASHNDIIATDLKDFKI